MMRVLVIGGGGRIGSAAAWDLASSDEVDEVGLVGPRVGRLERAAAKIGGDKLRLHPCDVAGGDLREVRRLMDGYDVGVIALPDRRTSYRALEAAIDACFDAVDVLEEYHRRPDPYETEGLPVPAGITPDEYGESLHRRAEENGVALLDGMGFAPGLSNATIGRGIDLLDSAERATARVGGVPSKEAAANHPLGYTVTWSFGHVLREYMVRPRVLRGGRIVDAEPLSDRERFVFEPLGEEFEAAATPGMPSLLYTRPGLAEFTEKTVRWPGHWEGIDLLRGCGLLDLEPMEVAGCSIRPRDLFISVVEPRLRPLPGETDLCIMANSVQGLKGGEAARVDHHLLAGPDEVAGISAMARVTGSSAAVAARLLGRGEVRGRGIVAPEDGIRGAAYDRYLRDLEARGIEITETVRAGV